MKQLKFNLENCFGITEFKEVLNFDKINLALIYAPNGTMKTSLADTLKNLSKKENIKERVHGLPTICEIKDENGNDIKGENVIVVNSFNETLTEDCYKLMVESDLQKKYVEAHKQVESSKEELFSNIKVSLKYSTRTGFNPSVELCKDYGKTEKELYDLLKIIQRKIKDNPVVRFNIDDIKHAILFSENAIRFYENGENSKLLKEYSETYDRLLEESEFLRKGVFDHRNFSNVSKSLRDNRFFSAGNKVIIDFKDKKSGDGLIKDAVELDSLLQKEKERILNDKRTSEIFERISIEIGRNKGTVELNNYLNEHPEFVNELNDFSLFKKRIWVEVFRKHKKELERFLKLYNAKYSEIEGIVDEAKKQETTWHRLLEVFNCRFHMPFKIKPTNLDDVILLNKAPSFQYVYDEEASGMPIDENLLLEVMSTGEKKAYFLLDLIYKIAIKEKEGDHCLLVFDDIADSFDYKNKYAIIEYINEIIKAKNKDNENLFTVIILTHNFDFYRTVGSRIAGGNNCFITSVTETGITLEKGQYLKNYFKFLKQECLQSKKPFIIAGIPFVRNLIEYIFDEKDDEYKHYYTLTAILHIKDVTYDITIDDLEDIYNKLWLNEKANFHLDKNEKVIDFIYQEADRIVADPCLYNKVNIENKIVLSIAIRLKAEEFMIKVFRENIGDADVIIKSIQARKDQMSMLFEEFKKDISKIPEKYAFREKDLEKVVMMTPENIHINSFMYEPILDMQGLHLKKLYDVFKSLVEGTVEGTGLLTPY